MKFINSKYTTMKKSINFLNLAMGAFFLFAICTCNIANAQTNNEDDSLPLKSRIYKVSLFTNKVKEYAKDYGYLTNLSDSGLQLSSSPIYFSPNNKNNFSSVYNYDQLKKVIIIRKGAVGRSAGYGALIGLGAGLIAGAILSSNDNNSNNDGWNFEIISPGAGIALTGIAGAAAGALIGLIIGAVAHKTFIIDGNKKKYDSMHQSIFNNLFRHHSSSNNYSTQYSPQL